MNGRKKAVCLLCAAAMLVGCGAKDAENEDESSAAVMSTTATAQTTETAITTITELTATEPPSAYLSADMLAPMPAETLILPEQVDPASLADYFTAEPIPDAVFARINGVSYHENPNITRDMLRYLRVLHYDTAGDIHIGEMICNKLIADDLLAIFAGLYEAQYPIARMVLVDEYAADDNASMAANNTSCFNYRVIAGSSVLSYHAQGLAVDINPQYNPYVTFGADGSASIEPENGQAYADREMFFPMKITHDDLCYRLFTEHGFVWGGDWDTPKDYQHFEWDSAS